MRLLVIGGTRFIGHHIVQRARSEGHDITVFHRGVHHGEPGADVGRLLGDRNGDLLTDTWRWTRAEAGGGNVGLDSGHELALLRAWDAETP